MARYDRVGRGLGVRVVAVQPYAVTLALTVRAEMLNAHGVCHGGVIFSLADSAFAYACNSQNDSALATAGTIQFLSPAREGEELIATARFKKAMDRAAASAFYQVVNLRYEKQHSTIVTTNRGLPDWGEIFGDTVVAAAILDRLMHNAVVFNIKGPSWRLREHQALTTATTDPDRRRR